MRARPPLLPVLWRPLPAVASVGLLVAAWEAYVRLSGVSPTTLPAPSRVAAQLIEHREVLWANTLPTLQATLLGFACSLGAAFLFSVLIDFARPVRRALFPVFIISQTLPLVAIAPLVVLWFGFGLAPEDPARGARHLLPDARRAGRRLRGDRGRARAASRLDGRVPLVDLPPRPHALGASRTSSRASGSRSPTRWSAAIFAEYAGAARGLGIYILNAKNNFRPDLVLAAVLVSAALTLALFAVAALLQRLSMPWRRLEAQR